MFFVFSMFISLALTSLWFENPQVSQRGLSSSYIEVSQNEVAVSDYCQNLYWQPRAEEKLIYAGCDIKATSREITRVQSGKY